jgi:hypothetical protein
VRCKLFIQRLWQHKIEWDEPLSADLSNEWNDLRDNLSRLSQVKIDRFILCEDFSFVELHGFCDASEKAFGACIYIRSIGSGGNIKSSLLTAKSKIAPLQRVTLARLELNAAELLANLYEKVNNEIEIKFTNVLLWSDSSIALSWINTESNLLNTFVGNRVSRIQSITKSCSWKHIRSQENPADILSRGCTTDDLNNSKLWWNGPWFLERAQEQWPQESFKVINNLPEMKPVRTLAFINNSEENFINDLINKYNSTRKIQRIIAFICRFIHNCKFKNQRKHGLLSVKEHSTALKLIIKHLQQQCLADDYFNI